MYKWYCSKLSHLKNIERNLLTIKPCPTISHHLNYKSTTIVFFKIDYQQLEYVRSYRASDDTVQTGVIICVERFLVKRMYLLFHRPKICFCFNKIFLCEFQHCKYLALSKQLMKSIGSIIVIIRYYQLPLSESGFL